MVAVALVVEVVGGVVVVCGGWEVVVSTTVVELEGSAAVESAACGEELHAAAMSISATVTTRVRFMMCSSHPRTRVWSMVRNALDRLSDRCRTGPNSVWIDR